MFKNISYGQVGFTNVRGFKAIFGDALVEGDTIAQLVDNTLALSAQRYRELCAAQQGKLTNYTYYWNLVRIADAFDMLA